MRFRTENLKALQRCLGASEGPLFWPIEKIDCWQSYLQTYMAGVYCILLREKAVVKQTADAPKADAPTAVRSRDTQGRLFWIW